MRRTAGGYIGDPLDGGSIGVFSGDAKFGFSFQCDAGVKGEIAYLDTSTKDAFPGLRLHGTVENVLIEVVSDDPATPEDETVVKPAATCEEIVEAPAAHFEGSYRSLERRLCPSRPAGSTCWCLTKASRAACKGISSGTGSPSNSRVAPTTGTPGAATSRAATSRRSE